MNSQSISPGRTSALSSLCHISRCLLGMVPCALAVWHMEDLSLSKTCFSCLGHLLKPETSNSSSWSNNGLLLPPLPATLTPKGRSWFLTFCTSTFSLDSHCSSLPLSLDQWFSNSYLSPLRGFWGWKGRGIELAGLEASHLNRAVACLSILHTIWRALSG